MRYYNTQLQLAGSVVFLHVFNQARLLASGFCPFIRQMTPPPVLNGVTGCSGSWMSGVTEGAELAQASMALWWPSVVNKQKQVPESLDGADLGSRAPGM